MSDQTAGVSEAETTSAPPKVRRSWVERIARGIGCAVIVAVALFFVGLALLQNMFKGPDRQPVVPQVHAVHKTIELADGAPVRGAVAVSWNGDDSDLATVSFSVGAPYLHGEPIASRDAPRPPFLDPLVKVNLGDRSSWGCSAPCEFTLPMACKPTCSFASDLFVELLAPPGSSASVVVTLAVIPPLNSSLPAGLNAKLDVPR
jgi:hypothetical protein